METNKYKMNLHGTGMNSHNYGSKAEQVLLLWLHVGVFFGNFRSQAVSVALLLSLLKNYSFVVYEEKILIEFDIFAR